MSNLDKLKENLKSSGPIFEFKTPIVPYDIETGMPILDDYLLWCDGTKYTVTGTTNLYLLEFYNYLLLNSSLASVFGVNTTEQSFIVPNLKDRVLRNTGSLIAPYASQEDAIQNITGGGFDRANSYATINGAIDGWDTSSFTDGAIKHTFGVNNYGTLHDSTHTGYGYFDFDASRVVRTAGETRVKAYGVFTCIDISGGAMAQLAKALEGIE